MVLASSLTLSSWTHRSKTVKATLSLSNHPYVTVLVLWTRTALQLMKINPHYNLLGILRSLFTYKFKNDKSNTPVVLLNILTPASEIHSYYTRYATNQNFFKQSVRTNYGISTFKFSAIKIWESVPPELKRLPYMLFKMQYKRFLLGTQH